MITAKEARAKRKKLSPAVEKSLEELDFAIQVASPTKSRVDFKTEKLTESERDTIRSILISLGYDAFITGEKLEVMW
ncbi:hypothetical protein [Vibrio phage XZ1]|nr:hypothetical protein AVU32_gp217 [Vibrio phage ValKK3]ALP47277.1 hypothetical protein phiGrn1_0159 [Vibrio phage phi-Grn1]ALP47657.1 hypothetical protein phiST2_0290 [Vibrio phage phi-ST2]QBX06044.1 hypothetical protein Va3_090 [Vibrio phage Va3]QNJ54669.1 hypothetical protein vBValMR10Z_128 [Vibrio phage vB_ValM_R10Z]QNJ55055.1 hypothetical protein vBValMR11Z_129 [Vibrio phage vB_ValM_R11Z]UOL51445.1 hypothetical protein [Vibrio phage XZ1]